MFVNIISLFIFFNRAIKLDSSIAWQSRSPSRINRLRIWAWTKLNQRSVIWSLRINLFSIYAMISMINSTLIHLLFSIEIREGTCFWLNFLTWQLIILLYPWSNVCSTFGSICSSISLLEIIFGETWTLGENFFSIFMGFASTMFWVSNLVIWSFIFSSKSFLLLFEVFGFTIN